MKKRIFLCLPFGALFGCASSRTAAAGPGTALVVGRFQFPGVALLLANNTKAPLHILGENCSWGCDALRVEFEDHGRLITGRREKDFTMNVPSLREIPAFSKFAFHLNMQDPVWRYDAPLPALLSTLKVRWCYKTVKPEDSWMRSSGRVGKAVTFLDLATAWTKIT